MKKSKFIEQQIVFALHQAETGVKVEEVCRKMGISEAYIKTGSCTNFASCHKLRNEYNYSSGHIT